MLSEAFAAPTSDLECLRYVAYKEARGEPIKAVNAVITTVKNRSVIFNKSICEVASQKGAFPYFKKNFKFVKDKKFLHKFELANNISNVLDDEYLYFNTTKFSWGRNCKKFGKLIFCK